MITFASVAITMTVGLVLMQYAHGQSDFELEANVNPDGAADMTITTPALTITKFEIQGKEICPSLQCKIDYKDKYTLFRPPDIPESTLVSTMVDFRLQDDITHADLGPKKKELVEEYRMDLTCDVYDIVETNGQELYYCHNAPFLNSYIHNKFEDRTFNLNINGTYNAKNETIKVSGNFTE